MPDWSEYLLSISAELRHIQDKATQGKPQAAREHARNVKRLAAMLAWELGRVEAATGID